MITSIKHKNLRLFWEKGDGSRLPAAQLNKIRRVLDAVNALKEVPQDLEPFKNWRPHQLKGELKDFWSLDVTGNYRILFRFRNGEAYDLTYKDTH